MLIYQTGSAGTPRGMSVGALRKFATASGKAAAAKVKIGKRR